MTEISDIIQRLKEIAKNSANAEILRHLEKRTRAVPQSDIPAIKSILLKTMNIDPVMFDEFFKTLEKIGIGAIAGERKFVWNYEPSSVGQAALQEDATLKPMILSSTKVLMNAKPATATLVMPVSYPLRSDFIVKFDLPADVTQAEIDKIVNLIKTLPIVSQKHADKKLIMTVGNNNDPKWSLKKVSD